MFTVDCQSHLFPEAYAQVLAANSGSVRAQREGPAYTIHYGDVQSFALNPAVYDPRRKLADMDAAGVDMAVLSVNMPGPEVLDAGLALRGARVCNDYVAQVCREHPDRFAGLAALPLQDMPAAMGEYQRAIGALGLRGVVLYSHLAGTPVDAAALEPLYAQAEADGVPLVLHPTVPTWGRVVKDYSMIPMVGLMVDHSIAMLRLILGGVLERHPSLRVVHPHCGGVLPYLMPRIEEQTEVKRRGREHITRPPGDYYRQVYLDLVSPSPLAIEFVYRAARPDRLLFASDHPWVSIKTLKDYALALNIPQEHKAMLLGENARKLFRL